MASRILITGGTGFLGSYIIRELIQQGFTVSAIRRPGAALPSYISSSIFERVNWLEGDILDPVSLEEAMKNADTVIHAAAIVSFSPRHQKEMYHVNVDGTANVVNAALDAGISRFVYISSVAALGRTANGGHVNEEKKWEESKVNTHYAKSKYKAEVEVWRGVAEGLNAVVLNPSTVLGYGNWMKGSSAIFRNVHNGFRWYTAGINGFVDVEDVARATILLMQSGISEQRFIVSGDNWPFRQLMDRIAENFGVKKPAKLAGPAMLELAWRIEKIKSLITNADPLLTRESSRVGQSRTYFDNQKILNALPGFSFTPLNDTIRKACLLYKTGGIFPV